MSSLPVAHRFAPPTRPASRDGVGSAATADPSPLTRHLLVTNDFPPKHGGIQSYLWELWRRLPAGDVNVLTTRFAGDLAFDAAQRFSVHRVSTGVLLPTPSLRRRVDALAERVGADLVVLDPALPLGLIGPRLARPYAVVLHGAEVTVPARLPGVSRMLRKVISGATHVIAAGSYPAAEARRVTGDRMPGVTVVPPGVDVERFVPLDPDQRGAVRHSFGLPATGCLVLSVSRLVPRKGMDALIEAAVIVATTDPGLIVAIGGDGRDRRRLERLALRRGAPVHFLGRVADDRLASLYACADVFVMACRNRWFGLEQEGFGIVFIEAAACGVPQVAGRSGGAADAVAHGVTGIVVEHPRDATAVASGIAAVRPEMGPPARERAVSEFSYDVLARRLEEALQLAAGMNGGSD